MQQVASLLEKISSSQIDDLIFEQRLASEGYRFYYSIDSHDIHKYCFPGNIDGTEFEKNQDGNINFDLETDTLTAYDEFFKNIIPENPVFLFQEYLSEMLGLRDLILKMARQATIVNYADSFLEHLEKLPQDKIPEDFTLFIAIATGFLRDGVRRFNGLMNNQNLIVGDQSIEEGKDQVALEECFSLEKKSDSEFAEKIFDVFLNSMSGVRRFSKKIDSDVIARLIHFNNFLLQTQGRNKLLFLYLSSTSSSIEIFPRIGDLLPRIRDTIFNFHRTVAQLFLSRLYQDLSTDLKLERLVEAKKLVRQREENQQLMNSEEESYKQIKNSIIVSYKSLSEKYVNINFARKTQFSEVESLSTELEKAKKNLRFGSLKSLYNNLKKLSEEHGDQKVNIEDLKQLENAIKVRQVFAIIFKKSFSRLIEGKPIQMQRGSDLIVGVGQHLPIVFLYKKDSQDTTLDQIGELFLELSIFTNNTINLNLLVQNRISALSGNDPNNGFQAKTLQEKLVSALYLLILPEANPGTETKNSQFVEDFLFDIYQQELKGNVSLDIIVSDIMYTLAWVLRRNLKLEEALEVTKAGLEAFPNDARFVHSAFLIKACVAEANLQEEEEVEVYDSFITIINDATAKYNTILANKSDLIKNNIIATLLNSDIYATSLRLSKLDLPQSEKFMLLTELHQGKLGNLKRIMRDKYYEYPEFLHTEAFLETLQSQHAENETTKLEKARFAQAALNKAIQIANNLLPYNMKEYEKLNQKLAEIFSSPSYSVSPPQD
jgi:hypothetical protein